MTMNRMGANGGFVLSCHAAEIRGHLKHSQISNRFLLYRDARHLLQAIREHGVELQESLDQLIALTADVNGGFSPIPTVRMMGTFRALPETDQTRLLKAIRHHYEAGFRPADKAMHLAATARRFLSAMNAFVEAEGTPETHERLRKEALRLGEALGSLPTGVWLWP